MAPLSGAHLPGADSEIAAAPAGSPATQLCW